MEKAFNKKGKEKRISRKMLALDKEKVCEKNLQDPSTGKNKNRHQFFKLPLKGSEHHGKNVKEILFAE